MKDVHEATPELQALKRIEDKLDTVGDRMDAVERRASVAGAVAGGVSGSLAGGIVASAIYIIKAKMGW